MLESRIFAIQEDRAIQHGKFEGAFEAHSKNFENYRREIDSITTQMKSLATQTTQVTNELVAIGKDELALIIQQIQSLEEELIIVR